MILMARLPDPRAKVIEDALFQYDLSIRWLAEKIGRSHVAVSEWLKGEAKPQKQEVWGQMLNALDDHAKTLVDSDNFKIRRNPRLTISVLPITVDVLHIGDVQTDVYMESITINQPEDGRKLWSRKVRDTKVLPHAEPGDYLLFDERPAEIGHVVDAMHKGQSVVRVLAGTKERPRLISTDVNNPEAIEEDFAVRGVASIKVEKKPGGVKVTTEYEFGVIHRF
jgi:hypothetical protein